MENLIITTIQTDLFWEDTRKNLIQLEDKIRSIGTETNLIVLPEMFSTGFSMNPEKFAEKPFGHTFEWMKKQAGRCQAAVTGSYIVEEDGLYYNRLVWIEPDGRFQVYNKRHLFSLSEEPSHYAPGSRKAIISYRGWKICPLICYDLRFPVWSRNTEDYDLLIYVANWPEKRSHHWRSLLLARAIENQTYTVGVNRVGRDGNEFYHSGDTTILDYSGRILSYDAHIEKITTSELSFQKQQDFRRRFPFLADRDSFNLY